jgi:hypothetical protein
MEQNIKFGSVAANPVKKNNYFFLIMNISLALILPVLSIAGETILDNASFTWELIGKWFIFWAVGIRLFTAGINQASNPGFTARIFNMRTQESFIVIKELGFANISLGVMGILSVINNNWRLLAAVTAGLFFGLAGIQHVFRKPDNRNEMIAMLYDLFVLLVILFYLSFTIIF